MEIKGGLILYEFSEKKKKIHNLKKDILKDHYFYLKIKKLYVLKLRGVEQT
jgi:hypothetical protein